MTDFRRNSIRPFVPMVVERNGVVVTDFEFVILGPGEHATQESDWQAPLLLDGRAGFRYEGPDYAPLTEYRAWARIDGNIIVPVADPIKVI